MCSVLGIIIRQIRHIEMHGILSLHYCMYELAYKQNYKYPGGGKYFIISNIVFVQKLFLEYGPYASADPDFLHISSSCVTIRLHTKLQLPRLTGSALKVCVIWCGVVGSVGGPTNYLVTPTLS